MLSGFLVFFVCFIGSVFAETAPAQFKLFSGNGNPALAKAVSDSLGVPLSNAFIGKFSDGEIRIDIEENIRNSDIYVLQSISVSPNATVNDNLMELFLMVRAMKRASAKSVTAIIPYYGYGRQDRKTSGRSPISASDVAILLELSGADQVISIDLHCGQIQGFFHHIPHDNLLASMIFISSISRENLHDPVIISPDAGGVERAKNFIEGLQLMGVNSRLAIIVKQRAEAGVVDSMNLVGNVTGSDVVIVDDICDTAGTLVKAAQELKKQGAARVYACITHPLFSGPALDRIASSPIHKLMVSDTIPLRNEIPSNVEQLSIAPLLAEAIKRHSQGQSLKELAFLQIKKKGDGL